MGRVLLNVTRGADVKPHSHGREPKSKYSSQFYRVDSRNATLY